MTPPTITQRLHHLFALALLLAITSFCACKPAATPTARETVRGALLGMANAMQYATLVCADAYKQMPDGPEADALFKTCRSGWETARASLNAADRLVDVWDEAVAPKVVCLASRALEALAATMTALRKLGVAMPADVKATIDDGVRLGEWLLRIAARGECEVASKGVES